MDGTPIFDIKPYLPYTDAHPQASSGFTADYEGYHLTVRFPEDLLKKVPPEKQAALRGVLAQDPRPSYQEDPTRVYGMAFGGLEVKFSVRTGSSRCYPWRNRKIQLPCLFLSRELSLYTAWIGCPFVPKI